MPQQATMTDRKRFMFFLNLLVICVASTFLSTALSTALPPIIADLHISVSKGQWLTSGYSLVMGIMMPLTAFLMTRFPTKKLYISAIAIFLAGLVVSAVASNFEIMMLGRILQAASNGITTTMVQVVLLSIYPPEKKGTVMGWCGLTVGAAPVIAPTLAGVLADQLNWQMIFLIPFVILLLALAMALRVFDDVLETKKQEFDILSFVLSGIAFGGLTLGIGNISNIGLHERMAWLPLVVGIVGAIAFTIRQLRTASPFLNLRLFRYPVFTMSVLCSMALYLNMMGSSLLMPLYVQSVLGYSATQSGLVTLPGSLAMAITSPLTGMLFDKIGMRKIAIAGAVCMILSAFGMVWIRLETPVFVAALLNIIRSVATGCMLMPFVTWGCGRLSGEETPHGTALLTSLRTVAGAIGMAVFVGIMNTVSDSSAAIYGERAGMHGVNTAFFGMTLIGILLFILVFFGVKDRNA